MRAPAAAASARIHRMVVGRGQQHLLGGPGDGERLGRVEHLGVGPGRGHHPGVLRGQPPPHLPEVGLDAAGLGREVVGDQQGGHRWSGLSGVDVAAGGGAGARRFQSAGRRRAARSAAVSAVPRKVASRRPAGPRCGAGFRILQGTSPSCRRGRRSSSGCRRPSLPPVGARGRSSGRPTLVGLPVVGPPVGRTPVGTPLLGSPPLLGRGRRPTLGRPPDLDAAFVGTGTRRAGGAGRGTGPRGTGAFGTLRPGAFGTGGGGGTVGTATIGTASRSGGGGPRGTGGGGPFAPGCGRRTGDERRPRLIALRIDAPLLVTGGAPEGRPVGRRCRRLQPERGPGPLAGAR